MHFLNQKTILSFLTSKPINTFSTHKCEQYGIILLTGKAGAKNRKIKHEKTKKIDEAVQCILTVRTL